MAVESYPPIPPAGPKKNTTTKKLLLGCGGLTAAALVCVCAFVAFGFYLQYAEEQAYNQARSAYDQGDCAAAVPVYEKLIDDATDLTSERLVNAQQELKECQALQAAQTQDEGGDSGRAMLSYVAFLNEYSASPLAGKARQNAGELYRRSGAQKLATSAGFCDGLGDVLSSNVLPDRNANAQDLYPACAMFYETQGQFRQAAGAYEAFLAEFPDHPGRGVVEAMLAKALVQAARASGAGEIPAPQVSGSAAAGVTVVEIQNDSPDRLRIIFSGPATRIEELEPCANCQEYINSGPEACPELGPVGRYEQPPGAYDVVVESGSGGEVTPWSGNWALADGDEYSSCFFIIQTSSP